MRFDHGSRVYITANAQLRGATSMSGLCGNFNGVTTDDLKIPSGSMATSVTEFANGWKADSLCVDASSVSPCEANADRKPWAEKG